MILRAPAKLNLCLYLGPRRDDGLHELCSLTQSLTLADTLTVARSDTDSVVCPGIDGVNLASRALKALRARGWSRPPLRIEIEKRIPVAAGLGGGSADAAAVLRLARDEVDGLEQLARELGADVPSQLDPGLALMRGAGERVEPLPAPARYGVVLIPSRNGLATAEVYAEADRLGLGRESSELEELGERLQAVTLPGTSPLAYAELLANDLQHAALSLRPEVAEALDALEEVGAARALVTGSGPAAFGLFEEFARAERAAAALSPRFGDALVAAPFEGR
ncbi:MAG TPA: 4-(cytidine 5'-diphospho)-2-C-methyl-D-erythritol kinase [Solirubrobacterales bacterium]|nr:4-(cytidine 5'-diphospho)-2-C-methyl-D-erythritol kinase [Solirubrobacterales bacterium]